MYADQFLVILLLEALSFHLLVCLRFAAQDCITRANANRTTGGKGGTFALRVMRRYPVKIFSYVFMVCARICARINIYIMISLFLLLENVYTKQNKTHPTESFLCC